MTSNEDYILPDELKYDILGIYKVRNALRKATAHNSFNVFAPWPKERCDQEVIMLMDVCNCASFIILHVVNGIWEYYTWHTYNGISHSFDLNNKTKIAFDNLLNIMNEVNYGKDIR